MDKVKKLDRRVRRTRRSLHEALLALIVEQEYTSITIQGITEKADLNRATFYLHYGSKDELLMAALKTHFEKLVNSFEAELDDAPFWESSKLELLTFQYVGENAPLYKVLLSERGTDYITHRIINYIAEYGRQRLIAEFPPDADISIPLELVAQQVAGSLFALLSWWVQNDMPYTPDYMAELTHRLCAKGSLDIKMQAMS